MSEKEIDTTQHGTTDNDGLEFDGSAMTQNDTVTLDFGSGQVRYPAVQEGWKCPRCLTINSPWKMQCSCSEPVVTGGTTITIEE